MENTIAEEKMILIPKDKDRKKGGLRTMPFIIVNEAFERVASYGLMPNMIFYLMNNYRLEAANGSTILFLWSAMSNGLSIFGAFFSDSFMGRYLVISLGSFCSLLGMILLWLTAMIPQLQPPPCDRFTDTCLNRACIIIDPDRDVNLNGSASNPWRLCTVDQVVTESSARVIPIWTTGILMHINLNQNSFATLQANTMDRNILNFELPAGSLNVFLVLTLTIWLTFYDRILLPLLARFTGRPRGGLSPKVRIGIGLPVPVAARAMSAVVETIRRKTAIEEGLEDEPDGVVNMSLVWLLPPIILLGLAEAFNSIGQIEFYYSQFPKSMSTIAVALFTFGTAVADLIGEWFGGCCGQGYIQGREGGLVVK
ncbi:hypothetical protein H0E87_029898 [Populus deltoides]|uniref:Uncharacterized protein n=1 Tax=Populus deltoides TaxID=3696 RepID=A0A8T2WSD0_POPDE|nr:hypothetical protein H0E87_029898 [Populus deltoides]